MAPAAGEPLQVRILRRHMDETARRLQGPRRSRESLRGKTRGEQPVCRGLARVKGLGIRAKHLPQPYGLGSRDAEGVCHLLFVQSHQPADPCRGAERAHAAGHVPTPVVMRRAHRLGNPLLSLDADDERLEHFLAAGALALGVRQQRWQDGGAGVQDRVEEGIVVVKDV